MGHDIIAGEMNDEQVELLREQLNHTEFSRSEWDNRFNGCGEFVATLRRSAYDVHGRVLYVALGADNFYAGCSGYGLAEWYTLPELKAARANLPYIVADTLPPIDTSEANDQVLQFLLKRALTHQVDPTVGDTPPLEGERASSDLGLGIVPEEDFLDEICTWMETNNRGRIRIYFG